MKATNDYNVKMKSSFITDEDLLVIKTLFEVIKLRDIITSNHSLAVATYNYIIASEFDRKNAALYYIAGLVHDIGKIAMPDSILKSAFKLKKEDKVEIYKHVSDGSELLEILKLPPLIVNTAKYHHERYDGSGYCRGLKGDKIPLCARISAITDTYTTITSGRLRIPDYPDGYSEYIRTVNRQHPDTLSMV